MTSPGYAVQALALSKYFGPRTAVAGVELSLRGGDCLALFGPNGAGKTTLLRLVAGLLKPTHGTVLLDGEDVRRDASSRARVGLISHQSMLYAPLTALENVEFTARLYGVPNPRQAALRSLEQLGVAGRADIAVRALSRGLQQRVSIARAMVHEPAVVLLDEPYSGLDESGTYALTTQLRALQSRGATLMLVTHNVAEGLTLATHAAIMSEGCFLRFEEREPAASFDAQRFAVEYRELVIEGAGGAA
jgi:heme exporter protein A